MSWERAESPRRKAVGETKAHWHGPGHVLGVQGSRIWVANATKVYRCSPEQVRRLNPEQEKLVKLLAEDLQLCKQRIRERGAGNVVELAGREIPPPEWLEAWPNGEESGVADEPGHEQGSGSSGASGPVRMEVEGEHEQPVETDVDMAPASEEREGNPPVPETIEHGQGELRMQEELPRLTSEPEAQGEPEAVEGIERRVSTRTDEPVVYGPQRPVSSLTAALRRSARTLDFGRPIRQSAVERDDEDEGTARPNGEVTVLPEEAFLTEAKRKRKSEVSERETREKVNLPQAKATEWKKMLDTCSVKVHVGKAAEALVDQVGEERLLASRFVVTRSDDEEKLKKGLVKARWCIRGYLDPDILELETAAPTLSPEGLAVTLQVLAELCIGDVEAAFLRGDNIQRSKGTVLVKVPPGGIPGLPEGAIFELLKPVYGLADAPRAWHESFTRALSDIGCHASQLDRCVYLCRGENGTLQGIIALHVDDMLCGGTEWFQEQVLRRLRETFPFKHFKKREGEFLGRNLRQDEDYSVRISQREYSESLECVKISRERRKQKDSAVTEEERRSMRAVLHA